MPPTQHKDIESYLDALEPEQRMVAGTLRALALDAADGVTEQIKWNAPSFGVNGDDRITLGSDRKGQIRAVLHRGAKAKNAENFTFDDPSGRVQWAATDRGSVTFSGSQDIDQNRDAIARLFRAWLAETTA